MSSADKDAQEVPGWQEIREMFKETDKRFKETDKRFKETDKRFKETDKQFKETDKQFKETDKQFKETDKRFKENEKQFKETDKRLDKMFKETDKQFKETDKQLKETDRQLKETDRQFKETDKKFKETDRQFKERSEKAEKKWNRMMEMYGGLSNNLGDITHQFFLEAFRKKPVIHGMKFDEAASHINIYNSKSKTEAEIDILLTNGTHSVAIEVKQKCHPNDVKKLYEKQLPVIQYHINKMKCDRLIVGIASKYFVSNSIDLAHEFGFIVIKEDGQAVSVDDQYLKEYGAT